MKRMAKKKLNPDHYEYVTVTVCDGDLSVRYKLRGNKDTPGRDRHDEDVSDWTDQQIAATVRSMLSMELDDNVHISIERI